PIVVYAVILPLFVIVAEERHVIGFVCDGKIGEYALVGLKAGEDLIAQGLSDKVGFIHINLGPGSVVAHLADLAFADNVEALDHLKGSLPIPNIGGEFKSFA